MSDPRMIAVAVDILLAAIALRWWMRCQDRRLSRESWHEYQAWVNRFYQLY